MSNPTKTTTPALARLMMENKERPRNYRVEASGDEATIYIYDVIGFDFWSGGGVTAKDFAEQLDGITAKTVHLRINSPGGDVFEARAMIAAMARHQAKFVAHVDGIAASAASFLAVNAGEVEMGPGSMLMIHNAWTMAIGDKSDLLATAGLLEKIDTSIAADYAKKSGKSNADIAALMNAETWFTAEEAVEAGLADSVSDTEVKNTTRWNLSAYSNAPAPKATDDSAVDDSHIRAALERRLSLIEKIT
jgi:ATP-dependent Clp protease, protease subunit